MNVKMKVTARQRTTAKRAVIAVALVPLVLSVALAAMAIATPLPSSLVRSANAGGADASQYSTSTRFADREGGLLREVRSDDSTRARWLALDDAGESTVAAVIAAEDARFYEHPGVDPLAVARAMVTSAWRRRIVSGASTLTMQLARLVRPHPKTLRGKIGEMALALRIEASLSKREILEEYVNRAPFGPGLRGLDAASQFYFDKPPRALSVAEAATLASIPRGPSFYSLAKRPARVLARRDVVIGRMYKCGALDEAASARASGEPLTLHLQGGSFGAPHLTMALLAGTFDPSLPKLAGASLVETTIDRGLQREAEIATREVVRPLADRHVSAASVVVLDNASGEILAYVGSPRWDAAPGATGANVADAGGQNDGVRAKRQPGSTLKPFVYGLAMESLGLTPASALPDVELPLETIGGLYRPRNYDERWHGPVRLREALDASLNVPAVWTANALGPPMLLSRLHDLGFRSLGDDAQMYGDALALGDGEVTLLELANAYATLARGGTWRSVKVVRSIHGGQAGAGSAASADALPADPAPRRVMPQATADLLLDVLADGKARAAAFGWSSSLDFPFPVAAKTGTSKGYRDNWTVGVTREVTVAVWVGNFDGSPMRSVSGITGAGPLFHRVMDAAMRGRTPAPLTLDPARASADGLERRRVCPLSGDAPGDACPEAVEEWMPRTARSSTCTFHERVAIDRQTGLRAGPGEGCAVADVEQQVFERFPAMYLPWARAAGRPVAPEGSSPRCPAGPARSVNGRNGQKDDSGDRGELAIGYPHEGAKFLYDPGREAKTQALTIRVEAPAGTSRVRLKVDGQVVADAGAPYLLRWTLARGEHVLVAEADAISSEPRRIVVE